MAFRIISFLVVWALIILGLPVVAVSEDNAISKRQLWNCAAKGKCPKGLTPNRAETGLNREEKASVSKERKRIEQAAKHNSIELAYCASDGSGCPEGLTQEDAKELLKEGDPPLSAEDAKGDLKATRKCYCPSSRYLEQIAL
ncbi:MAG: hypothetical protein ABJN98_00475 [Roseibium sp.]